MFRRSNFGGTIPPVTKNLIIINALLWAVEMIFPSFAPRMLRVLGLHFMAASDFNPIQVVTYMFLHDPSSPLHIFFNMFTLWMFGRTLETVWGSRRFFVFYMICGMGAALVQEGVWALTWHHDYVAEIARLNGQTFASAEKFIDSAVAAGEGSWLANIALFKNQILTIGASGAIFGLLLGFAFVFPNMPLYLFFIPMPVKAKYMVAGYCVIEFFLGVSGTMGTVAHFAHLGGMLFGLLVLLYWKKKGMLGGRIY